MNDTHNEETPTTEHDASNEQSIPPDINQYYPEVERLRAENEQLKNTIRTRDAREIVTEMLQAAEARSPELLFAAVKDELQFSDDGQLRNAAELADGLRSRFPEQFGAKHTTPSIDGGAGTGGDGGRPPLSAESLARMTPGQIRKLDWSEVRRTLDR